MLILTRKVGESIIIGGEVEVMVLGVRSNVIRLGTKAPDTVSVHRKEIFKRIQQHAQLEEEAEKSEG